MDRRSWLWRRKSSEKSPGETESSGSASSCLERFSDDQEALRASTNCASPNFVQSPDKSSNDDGSGVHETTKSLTEKLSAALLNISAKEELVKQHAKVADEAIYGWEKAESEVTALKQQLEAAMHKISALEDQIGQLDGALKESSWELWQAGEKQEGKLHEAIAKKALEWETQKLELENQLALLVVQMESAKSEASTAIELGLHSTISNCRKEISAYKVKLLALTEDLQMRTLERDLSIQSAESASKQHLESIKKVARLEAECRRLRSMARKASPTKDLKMTGSICSESLTELNQFKSEKADTRKLTIPIEIDLIDDFLEMERLAALPQTDNGNLSSELNACANAVPSEHETVDANQKITELEANVEKMEKDMAKLEASFIDACKQLETSSNQLLVAEDKLFELQRQLDLTEKSKQLAMGRWVDTEASKNKLESLLEASRLEAAELSEQVSSLAEKLNIEKSLSADFSAKVELEEGKRMALKSHLDSTQLEVRKLHAKIIALEDSEAARRMLESQLKSAKLDLEALHRKVNLLEGEVEKERATAADLEHKVATSEDARENLDSQLESSSLEIRNLHDKLTVLEGKFDRERRTSASLATKCQNLEDELLKQTREQELRRTASSNGDLNLKQEKGLSVAAGKLAECQVTIASLNRHLELLMAFDSSFLSDGEKTELDGGSDALESEDTDEFNLFDSSAPQGMLAPIVKRAGPLPCPGSSSPYLMNLPR